jgi:hypothetical protein
MDDFNADPGVLVAIRRPLWKIIVSFAAALALAGAAAIMFWLELQHPPADPTRAWAVDRWTNVALGATWAFFALLSAAAFARAPEFAVRKDGIRLPETRRPASSSFWHLRVLGLYLWDEVSYCKWSHSQPGVLNIQTNGTSSLGKTFDPPTRLFYFVRDSYRADVEKAIRGRGKWAE